MLHARRHAKCSQQSASLTDQRRPHEREKILWCWEQLLRRTGGLDTAHRCANLRETIVKHFFWDCSYSHTFPYAFIHSCVDCHSYPTKSCLSYILVNLSCRTFQQIVIFGGHHFRTICLQLIVLDLRDFE